MANQSSLEQAFISAWDIFSQSCTVPMVTEYRFAPPRKWRFDFAWVSVKVAVELEGATWAGGRHTRGSGYQADCEKYNCAVMEGWAVLRYTSTMLKADPQGVVNAIVELVEERLTFVDNGCI